VSATLSTLLSRPEEKWGRSRPEEQWGILIKIVSVYHKAPHSFTKLVMLTEVMAGNAAGSEVTTCPRSHESTSNPAAFHVSWIRQRYIS